MNDAILIRRISDGDWDEIAALEAATYRDSGLSEGRAALESRGRVSPATCFALDCAGRLAGYLLALPYPPFQYPELSGLELAGLEETAVRSRNLHLHDLVIAERLRGRGLGRRLLHRLAATAESQLFERISLVAVGGADTFWSANGFSAHPDVQLPVSYGPDAVYMSTAVPGDRAERSNSKPINEEG
ncbi:GNAT family N-acetyltransferase [Kitasatospora sp. GAS1066B]|uniref:GNAT family N-acetyltransferase n=1 Tax=Kitasatospora sp. GAS1066B TaxID=3156271 RepID=UPI0035164BA0